jgi:hypothetical protein
MGLLFVRIKSETIPTEFDFANPNVLNQPAHPEDEASLWAPNSTLSMGETMSAIA